MGVAYNNHIINNNRNERHNTWGKLSQKFTTEGDLFLGQKTIEVMTLGAAQDLWYTLGRYILIRWVWSLIINYFQKSVPIIMWYQGPSI